MLSKQPSPSMSYQNEGKINPLAQFFSGEQLFFKGPPKIIGFRLGFLVNPSVFRFLVSCICFFRSVAIECVFVFDLRHFRAVNSSTIFVQRFCFDISCLTRADHSPSEESSASPEAATSTSGSPQKRRHTNTMIGELKPPETPAKL